MAIAVIFEMLGMTREQYEESFKKITKGPGDKLADWPAEGVLAHMAGPMPSGWRVIDIYESEEVFQKMGKIVGPIIHDLGFAGVEPKVLPLTRVIKD